MRALYEDSAVPVREIAAIAGATERTIYKYVAKLGWKRRHHFAPAKGAGGIDVWSVAADAVGNSPIAVGRDLLCLLRVFTCTRQACTSEITRMNWQTTTLQEYYVLLVPVAVGALGLGVFWLTGWMDRREERRHPAE